MKNKKQYKVGDKVKYDGEECMVINIGIEDFCIGVELDELD